MSTPPLGAGLLQQLRARSQATRFSVTLKEVRQFRAYCCNIDAAGIMGVAKEPVVILNIDPNPVCVGAELSWDMTDSYAPASTISSWDIDFGDGDTDTGGDIADAFGTHTYDEAGTYTITATVEEGGMRDQTTETQVIVIDCGEPPLDWSYAALNGGGVYFMDWTAGTPTWEARNNGLTGDALFVRSLVMRPGSEQKAPSQHELWIATLGGVYRSEDGGNSWARIALPDPSNAEFLDTPAATVDELDWVHIVFDPLDPLVVYIEARKAE